MLDMDIVFVVLHYMTIEETRKCVAYIRKNIDTSNYHIVIVDNASPNKSGQVIKEDFEEEQDITVILNEINHGFARGNNIGYNYAKKRWNPRYIVLLNNDVFLYEKELVKKLDKDYEKSEFYVLGPLIMTGDGRCDINPDKAIFKSSLDIDKAIHNYKKVYFRYKFHYAKLYNWVISICTALFNIKRKSGQHKPYLERAENVKLHGCFLVFSNLYISQYAGLDDSTFLYWEEEFLYKHMISDGKKTVYNPEIIVFHKEDAATDAIIGKTREKEMFICQNYIQSLSELKKLYNYYDKDRKK